MLREDLVIGVLDVSRGDEVEFFCLGFWRGRVIRVRRVFSFLILVV